MHKGFVLAKNSLLLFVLAAVFCFAVQSTGVLAVHDSIVTISPSNANCDELGNTFTVNVKNDAGSTDDIFEVRIYDDSYAETYGILEFYCGPAPTGWTLYDFTTEYGYCEYKTPQFGPDVIEPGEDVDFTYDAVMWREECYSRFLVSTLDNVLPEGEHEYHTPEVRIDCTPPYIVKTVGDPKIAGDGFDWWVTESTLISFSVTDDKSPKQCDRGVDYCDWRVVLDGVPGEWNHEVNGELLQWEFYLEGDSNHYIEVECYDKARNKATLTELDKVDDTPPVTTKEISEPKKIEGDVEWVDTVTEITLTAEDPDPTTYGCNIGVDKTWYKNILACGEEPCWDPYSYCNAVDVLNPYDQEAWEGCIDFWQEECFVDDYWELQEYDSWEDCVETNVHDYYDSPNLGCEVDPDWHLYDGTPIQKETESCHMLYYFSVDYLGNIEDMNVNCFFVDKTPPFMDKDNGQAIADEAEEKFTNEGNPTGLFHWITTSMPITFTCDDRVLDATGAPQTHPSEDEELCFRVSYDYYPDFGYGKTPEYCSHFGGTMDEYGDEFCCVAVDEAKHFVFNFLEESMHNIEYYCIDAVEKRTDTHVQYYKVDDTPPYLFDKWIEGPSYAVSGDCPPDDETDVCHIDGVTTIGYEVIDGGEICAVDEVYCEWGYTLDGGDFYGWYNTYPIHFPEESKHDLQIRCRDALGNEQIVDEETFFVDKTPPETTKTYVGPQYPLEMVYPKWITSDTEIHLSATDTVGPHDSGVKETKYRVTLVGDEACSSVERCQEIGIDGAAFNTYTTPFKIPDQSCHLIEYYSVDNVDKIEEIKRQCVFVENTAPTVGKIVGTPQEVIGDYIYITKTTPITLFCDDLGDHPVDHVSLWYRYRVSEDCVNWGPWNEWEDPTGLVVVNGHEVEKTIYFPEDSCHQLEYYCEDILGNEGTHEFEIDIVDTQPPVIVKTVGDPKLDCPVPQEVPPELCDGWACLDGLDKDFFTTGRYGDGNPTAGAWELAIWEVDGGETVVAQDNYGFTSGATVDFSVSYDPSDGKVTYIVGDKTLEWYYDPGMAFEYIIPFAKGNDNGNSVELTNMYLNGDALSDVMSGTGYKGLRVYLSDADQVSGFTLTGTAKLTWGGSPKNEIPGFHVFAMNTHPFDCYMIDGVTEITVDVYDPDPHPVDDVTCAWDYEVIDGDKTGMGVQEIKTFPFVINFPEESTHILYIKCWDKLGNTVMDIEKFIVDKTPPGIWKQYGDPYFEYDNNYYAEFINKETTIYAGVTDDGPHPTGINKVEYRVTLVDDEYCRDYEVDKLECEDAVGSGSWTPVASDYFDNFTFSIPDDSCHLIEIYAEDNVEKSRLHKQCVFVDNQAPTPNKTVGEPKTPWEPTEYGVDVFFYPDLVDRCWKDSSGDGMSSQECKADPFCIECWKVTMQTPITLDCDDPEPHPVDHEKVCFKVELDGFDETEDYCDDYCEVQKLGDLIDGVPCMEDNGYCCVDGPVDFSFKEETEHNLDFYCVDKLGNSNDVHDDEKFKVEGTAFEIPLYFKWNLISVPFVLLNDAPEEVFKDTPGVEAVWAYDGETGDWLVYAPGLTLSGTVELKEIEPGWGYWVMEKLPDDGLNDPSEWLTIGGSLFSPATVPPSRDLVKGWNLIGYYGSRWQIYPWSDENFMCGDAMNCWDRNVFGDKVYCALNSLVDTQQGFPKWSALWSYLNCGDYETHWFGLNTCPEDGFQELMSRMYAGRGYWLELDEDDLYAPATTCIWNEDWQCVSNFAGGVAV